VKIALLQIDATVGALAQNADAVIAAARKARAEGAELAVAPELVIPGYPPRDLLLVSSFRTECDRALARVAQEAPPDLPLLVGTIGRSGGFSTNAAALLRGGRIEAFYGKTLLPTYDVFDERRYFEPNPSPEASVFDLGSTRVGVTICEDLWNDAELWGASRRYAIDPVEEVVRAGARVVVNLSASPFAARKWEVRRKMLAHAARRHRVATVSVNAVGGNDGLIFDGASCVFGADGKPRGEARSFVEDLAVVDTESAAIELSTREAIDDVRSALVLGLRDYFRKVGATNCVIGLSGGIDSALVAALAVEAFGAEHVVGLGMPSPYSSEHSIKDAEDLARNLGIKFFLVPIGDTLAAYKNQLGEVMTANPPPSGWRDLTEENLQSRIRGATLMAFSNRTGAFVLTTGNKSECAVGYCTLYGDTCGGLAVIADLFKIEVYALSRRINESAVAAGRVAPIPESTLTKAPSAELRPNQTDQDDLPPYDVLDRVLEALIVRELGVEDAARATGDPIDLVRQIARRVRTNEYKRQQFPPTLRVSDRAWVGREYPIAQRFFE
jgi:NAD+ synthase/NAD+ synthase (glutamine-hydrolysing)